MSKKNLTRILVLFASILLLVAINIEALASEEGFDWKKYSGTTIRVKLAKIAWSDFIVDKLSEFTSQTGIKVIPEVMVETQLRDKLVVEFISGSRETDVFHTIITVDGAKIMQGGWFEELTNYVKNPDLTNPDYNFEDLTEGAIRVSTLNGKLIGVPSYIDPMILFYRKDLFEKYNVKVPTTLKELEEAAKKLTLDTDGDGNIDIYGWTIRGARSPSAATFSSFLFSMGGSWFGEQGKPALDTPEAIEAFELYGRLLRNYGPPGSLGNSWLQCLHIMQEGKAAMWAESGIQAASLEDPSQSKIAGKVGYATFPAGPGGSRPYIYGWTLATSSLSENKEAAWYFIQWATSKEIDLYMKLKGIGAARKSSWESPEYKAQDKYPELTKTLLKSYETPTEQINPLIVAGTEARDLIGVVVQTAINGEDVVAAAKKANKEFEDLIRKTQ